MTNGSRSPSLAEVEAWLASANSEIAQVNSDIAPLVERRTRLESQVALLEKLRQTFVGASQMAEIPPEASISQRREQPACPSSPRGTVGAYVVERARLILQEHGEPMHINDLYAVFLKRGYTVPGAGTAANLTAHLTRSDAIRSPKRGIYCLPEHDRKRSRVRKQMNA